MLPVQHTFLSMAVAVSLYFSGTWKDWLNSVQLKHRRGIEAGLTLRGVSYERRSGSVSMAEEEDTLNKEDNNHINNSKTIILLLCFFKQVFLDCMVQHCHKQSLSVQH